MGNKLKLMFFNFMLSRKVFEYLSKITKAVMNPVIERTKHYLQPSTTIAHVFLPTGGDKLPSSTGAGCFSINSMPSTKCILQNGTIYHGKKSKKHHPTSINYHRYRYKYPKTQCIKRYLLLIVTPPQFV